MELRQNKSQSGWIPNISRVLSSAIYMFAVYIYIYSKSDSITTSLFQVGISNLSPVHSERVLGCLCLGKVSRLLEVLLESRLQTNPYFNIYLLQVGTQWKVLCVGPVCLFSLCLAPAKLDKLPKGMIWTQYIESNGMESKPLLPLEELWIAIVIWLRVSDVKGWPL